MPISLMDEYLAHQTSEMFDHVATSDRTFYDRYYFNCHPSVGPLRVEVLEGLMRLRVICEANERGIAFDMTLTATVPAIEEPRTGEVGYGLYENTVLGTSPPHGFDSFDVVASA